MKKLSHLIILIGFMVILNACQSNGEQIVSKEAEIIPHASLENNRVYKQLKKDCKLTWTAWHLGGMDPRNGTLDYREAELLVNNGKLNSMSILLDMNSITVLDLPDDAIIELTDHLKSDDFFKVDSFPISKFEMTKLEGLEGDYNSKITGNLTILGISKSISFKGNLIITEKEIELKSQEFIINRAEWGMTYNAKGTVGIPLDYLISDDVQFQVDISILK